MYKKRSKQKVSGRYILERKSGGCVGKKMNFLPKESQDKLQYIISFFKNNSPKNSLI